MATPATRTRSTSRRSWSTTINQLEKLPSWKSTAVVIAYDDSDGWYDHQMGPIIDPVADLARRADRAPAPAAPTPPWSRAASRLGAASVRASRCWSISPFAKRNYVDGTFTDQSSVVQIHRGQLARRSARRRRRGGRLGGDAGQHVLDFDGRRERAGCSSTRAPASRPGLVAHGRVLRAGRRRCGRPASVCRQRPAKPGGDPRDIVRVDVVGRVGLAIVDRERPPARAARARGGRT